jgi:hypothetical protein
MSPLQPLQAAPEQLPIVPEPRTIAEAVKQMHDANQRLVHIMQRLEQWAEREQEAPEMHTVVINPSKRRARSIGIINPGTAGVFVGIGGVGANPTSRAPEVPPAGAMVIPVHVDYQLEVGCDPTVLGANSAVVYVFRYWTVQPLLLTGNV